MHMIVRAAVVAAAPALAGCSGMANVAAGPAIPIAHRGPIGVATNATFGAGSFEGGNVAGVTGGLHLTAMPESFTVADAGGIYVGVHDAALAYVRAGYLLSLEATDAKILGGIGGFAELTVGVPLLSRTYTSRNVFTGARERRARTLLTLSGMLQSNHRFTRDTESIGAVMIGFTWADEDIRAAPSR